MGAFRESEVSTEPMDYVILRVHKGAALSPGAARLLVLYALRRRGAEPWASVGVDAFSGAGETLLLARPEARVEVRLAPYVLPLLRKYFS